MQVRTTCLLILGILIGSQFSVLPGSLFVGISGTFTSNSLKSTERTSQAPVAANDIRFGHNVRIIDHSVPYAFQVEPTMAVLSTGRILVGWKEAETHDGPGRRVGFAYSIDEGRTFSTNILMEPTQRGNYQSDPWLVADHLDTVYFVFLDWDLAGDSGIGVAKSLDGGSTWLPTVDASDTPGFDDKETACVDSQGNLYLVWDEYNAVNQLRFTKSTDNGTTFQPTTSPFEPYIPYITCAYNDTLYVTTDGWYSLSGPAGDRVWITRSDDYGTTWTSKITVTPLIYDEVGIITVVDTDSQGNVYVAYSAGTGADKDIFVTKSTNGGYNWKPPVRVNNVTTGMQRMAEMTIDHNDVIHVAWLDARHTDWNIYYSYSDDGGVTFSTNVRVTSASTPATYWRPGDYFTMRTSPNDIVNLVWTDGRGADLDIFFAKQDVTAPVISHTLPLQVYQQYPLTLFASVTDDDYVEAVELRYQIEGSTSWRSHLMQSVGPDVFEASIAPTELAGAFLNYYFVARDAAGRETALPLTDGTWFTLPLQPINPPLLILIIGSVLAIAITVIFSVWYLRRPSEK